MVEIGITRTIWTWRDGCVRLFSDISLTLTLRPDKGAGLVPFFNFPWLDRGSEKWRATVHFRRSRGVGALCRADGPIQVTVLDRYKGW